MQEISPIHLAAVCVCFYGFRCLIFSQWKLERKTCCGGLAKRIVIDVSEQNIT